MPGKGSPEFVELLQKCIDVHYKKNHDYANDANPFSNFDRQREIVSWFSKPIDQTFTSVIAIKIARLAELLSNDITPNNESIEDNFVDLVNYCGLWAAWHKKNSSGIQRTKEPEFKSTRGEATGSLKETLNEIYSSYGQVPIICSRCEDLKIMDIDSQIDHAIQFHSAVFNQTQKSLKYPTRELILLNPSLFK